jgi:hypothetical protein
VIGGWGLEGLAAGEETARLRQRAARFILAVLSGRASHASRLPRVGIGFTVCHMCEACSKLPPACEITMDVVMDTHSKVFSLGICPGILEIVSGTMQWGDVIECELRCRHCGQMFRFGCETYHGSGGAWQWL